MNKYFSDTLAFLGLLAGLTVVLVVLIEFPIPGFILFLFMTVFAVVSLVNIAND